MKLIFSEDLSNPKKVNSSIKWKYPVTPLNFNMTEKSSIVDSYTTETWYRKDGYKSNSIDVSSLNVSDFYCIISKPNEYQDVSGKIRLYGFNIDSTDITDLIFTNCIETPVGISSKLKMYKCSSGVVFDYVVLGIFGDISSVSLFC